MTNRVIEIHPHGSSGFEVCVTPPDPGYPPAIYYNPRMALGAAGGLRLVTRWRKVDKTRES